MRISLVNLKKCLGIKEIELRPGKITILEGKGGEGKTSVLESLEKMLYNVGKRPKFVHGDAEKAEMYLLLDDGTEIKKNIKPDGKVSNVSVKMEVNGVTASPQAPESFLKSLVGEKQLNPVQFINMSEKEQTETILSLIPISISENDVLSWLGELPKINYNQHGLKMCKELYDYYYEERKKANKEVKDLKTEVENMKSKLPANYNPDEWRNISLQEKYEEISKANKINSDRQKCQYQIDNINFRIQNIESERDLKVKQLEDEIKRIIEDAQKKIAVENRNVKIAEEFLNNNPFIDIEPLESEHEKAEEMKSFIRTADDLIYKQQKLTEKEKEATELNDKVEYMRTKPQMLLSKSVMPIEGLSIDDSGNILINDLPIKNLCDTEKIFFALNIAKATAGPLKIILIDGFEKLSPADQKIFIEQCEKDDFQYIMTRVTDGDLRIISIDENGNTVDSETGEFLGKAV